MTKKLRLYQNCKIHDPRCKGSVYLNYDGEAHTEQNNKVCYPGLIRSNRLRLNGGGGGGLLMVRERTNLIKIRFSIRSHIL